MPQSTVQLSPPKLEQPYFQSLMVCACFKLSQSPLSKRVKKIETFDEREAKIDSSKGPAWIRVRLGKRDHGESSDEFFGRWQIDCALESSFSPSRSRMSPPNSWDEVREFLELAFKQKVSTTCCKGRFIVPTTELPAASVARILLDVSASADKVKMNLTGTTFSIENHPSIQEVKWELRPRQNKEGVDELNLTVLSYPDIKQFGGDLDKIAQSLSDGVQELVIRTAG